MNAPAIAAPPPLAEQLAERFWKLKRSRIRIVPAHSTRASSIGIECERELFYEQTAYEQRVLYGEELQALFDLGNHVERFVVTELEAMGVEVLERARDYFDRELKLSGHIDGKVRVPGVERPVPIEIKGLNPMTADRVTTLADIQNNRQAWVRKYYAQLQAYLELGDEPWGLFVLLNKSTGTIEFIDCPRDRDFGQQLRAKAARVRDAVTTNVAPERHRSPDCRRCPFAHVCLPDIDFGPGVQVVDEPELIEALRRREELRDAKRDFDAADRVVKALLEPQNKRVLEHGAGELLVGPYALTPKVVDRKAYTAKASRFVQWDVDQVATPAPAANLEQALQQSLNHATKEQDHGK